MFDEGTGYYRCYPIDLFVPVFAKCPCCGRETIKPYYDFDVCCTCGWEDDHIQRDDPDYAGGANHLSLNQFKAKWIKDKLNGINNNWKCKKAATYSHFNRKTLKNDKICGCYFCEKIYVPTEIKEWGKEFVRGEKITAICPYCGVDAVIGESSGYPMTPKFFRDMRKFYFESNE